MKHCLFYGTLRQNSPQGWNYGRFSGQKYIKTLTLDNYDLYWGGLPFAVPTEKGKGHLVVELQEVEDRSFEGIRCMEFGAGYKEAEITVDGQIAYLYYYDKAPSGTRKVENGDFSNVKRSY